MESFVKNHLAFMNDTSADEETTGGTPRADALQTLWRICGPGKTDSVTLEIIVQETINRMKKDVHPDVRAAAARIFTNKIDMKIINNPLIIQSLKAAIHDPSPKVRLAGSSSLLFIGKANSGDTSEIIDTLERIAQGNIVLPPTPNLGCDKCSNSKLQKLRISAIQNLGKMKHAKSKMILQKLAQDPDTLIKSKVSEALKTNNF
jgi:HEAT repeat protein